MTSQKAQWFALSIIKPEEGNYLRDDVGKRAKKALYGLNFSEALSLISRKSTHNSTDFFTEKQINLIEGFIATLERHAKKGKSST